MHKATVKNVLSVSHISSTIDSLKCSGLASGGFKNSSWNFNGMDDILSKMERQRKSSTLVYFIAILRSASTAFWQTVSHNIE